MRKELASSTKDFAKSISMLANSEEHINLSRALAQLGEVHEKIDQLQIEQANSDFFIFAELIKDYIGLFESVKEAFNQRIAKFHNLQKAQDTLRAKKDNKIKLEAANKKDKLPTAEAEINEWEGKVNKSKEEFEQVSKTIKQEVKKFDAIRVHEFKDKITQYLNNLLNYQTTVSQLKLF
jgi:sorting nexin-1/2